MKKLPQTVFVFLVLCGALVLILLIRRPHTACDSQLEVFKRSQTPNIFLDSSKIYSSKTDFSKNLEACKSSNSYGGCLDFFESIKLLLTDVNGAPASCAAELMSLNETRGAAFQALELLVQIAWGDSPPLTSFDKVGWLDLSSLALYCGLKKVIIDHLGRSTWDEFALGMFEKLPGANQMSRDDMWSRSLLSDNCSQVM